MVESWAADGLTHPFTVTFLAQQANRIHQERFEITSKYGRLEIPVQRIVRNVDLTLPYLVQIEPSGQEAACDVVLGFVDFVTARTEAGGQEPSLPAVRHVEKRAKVIVWDLDNTVWDGILGEDGIDGINLRPEIAAVIVELDKRGILQSVASKNDATPAMRALERFGLSEYILCPQISWRPKSESVHEIAQTLGLATDSFIFVDDQAFERAEVKEAHPDITVMPDAAAAALPAHPLCDVAITAESRSRRSMYQAEALRVSTLQTSKTSYLDFLKSCNIVLEVTTLKLTDRERIYELSQRTNQLNFCGTKYSREAVGELTSGALGVRTFVLRCSDRFGEYGVIGFVVVDVRKSLVLDFFMSCRVQRKHVENAFFAALAGELQEAGNSKMFVRVHKTDRNKASIEMLEDLGFQPMESSSDRWMRDIASPFAHSDTVKVELRSHEPCLTVPVGAAV